MKKYRQYLTAAVLCGLTSVGFVATAQAEETANHELQEVVVEASKEAYPGGFIQAGAQVGILGERAIMDTPFTKVNLTEKTINAFDVPGEALSSALLNVPSIRSASSTMYNDVNIRGTRVNGYQFYINGVPGLLTQTNIPVNFIENIEVTSGPAMGFTGTTAQETAGGMVNLVSKRAGTEDVTTYKQTFSGRSSFGEYIDVGRRFGKDKAWGLRVNAQNVEGNTAVPNEKLTARDVFINLDHQDAKSNTNLLAGYRYVNHKNGVRWFQYNGSVTQIPDAPNAKNNYSFNGQKMEYDTWLLTLNHEQKLNDNWSAYFTGGYSRYDLSTNYNAKSSAYIITNNNGDFIAQSWSKTFPVSSYYGQIGVKGQFNLGQVKNNITIAGDKAWYNNGSGIAGVDFNTSVTGNIYNNTHIVGGALPAKNLGGYSVRNEYTGISVADALEYGKAELILGVHNHRAVVDSYDAKTGVFKSRETSDSTSPTYAFSYKPDDKVTLYANHTESFNKGALVPNSRNGHTFENAGQMLSPTKTKQNEIGVKYNNKNVLTTLSLFEISQANNYDKESGGKWYCVQDGENQFKGAEVAVSGKLTDKLSALGGIMYLDATVKDAANKALNGSRVNGVSQWSGVLGLEYAATEDLTFLTRGFYNGSCKIRDGKLSVPSYFTLDLGVKYNTKINTVPVTLSAMCYNVTGKDYWITSGNTTILSNPRTFMLSAEFKL